MCKFLSLLLIVSSLVYSQITPWQWQHPKPHGNHLNDIVYFPSGKILTFGNGGTVGKTTDGGATWSVEYIDPANRDIYEADFVDENTGYAAGTSGLLMKTTNGGTSWQIISGYSQTFWYLDFIDADTGYVVGSASAILKTTDGGTTWNAYTLGVSTTVYRIFFLNASTGYLGTSTAANRLYKTTDYGATWVNITANVPFSATSTVRGIFFPDPQHGWLTTSLYEVYKTSDAGQTWMLQNDFGTGTLYDVKFVDSLKGVTVGAAGQIFITTDGGTNWQSKFVDSVTNMYGVAFKGNYAKSTLSWNDFVVCGTNGSTYITSDAGTSFSPMHHGLGVQDLRRIQFLDANFGYAAGGFATTGGLGELYRTTNGGQEWTKTTLQTNYRIYAQCWTNSQTGYFGSYGISAIYKTTDGGNTITQLSLAGGTSSTPWYDVAFVTPSIGFAGGSSGLFFRTTDAGATWAAVSSGIGTSALYDFCVVNSTTAFASGASGKIVMTTDAGATWTTMTSGTTSTIYGMCFVNSSLGFYCASSGRIAKTTDGGTTWNQLTSGVTGTLYSIQFADTLIGWCGGGTGVMLQTTDGGTTWTKSTAIWGTGITMYDLAYKAGKVWAVGTAATIVSAALTGASISVINPPSGVSLQIGAGYAITWSASGVQNVNIELSTNNGTTWQNIAQNVPAAPGVYNWTVPNLPSSQCKIRISDAANPTVSGISAGTFSITTEICRDLNIGTGWNMLAIPVQSSSMIPSVLFPTANSSAFAFANGYVIVDTFKLGTGYWMRFPAAITKTICGLPAPTNSVPVVAGWNLLGVYHQAVPVSGITSTPMGIVNSNFFGYENGYIIANLLNFGKGYWVRCSQAGQLHLNTTAKPPAGIDGSNSENQVRFTVSDAAGHQAELYVVRTAQEADTYVLPPLPPAGVFDVRYLNNSFAAADNPHGNLVTIQSAEYPVTITAQSGDIELKSIDGNYLGIIKEHSSFTISSPQYSSLIIASVSKPLVYKLAQNYPNPFNPATSITYTLQKDGAVSLRVYDVLGTEVAVLLNEEKKAGEYMLTWNAASLPSGTYFYHLQAGEFTQVKKMTLIK